MTWMRSLGSTGIEVSALGLGTVKFGRDQKLRYPRSFAIPDDRLARELLSEAREGGINLVDTAPAYGSSEERLGKLLAPDRDHWVLCTKVGEEFEAGESRFDFSPEHTRASILRSLSRLRREAIDIALIHSSGDDLAILQRMGTLEALRELQQEGLVRACGISTKTVEGGLAAASHCDVVMVAFSPADVSQAPVLEACAERGTGVLIKKALDSGHLTDGNAASALQQALAHCSKGSVVVGTVSPQHMTANISAARGMVQAPLTTTSDR